MNTDTGELIRLAPLLALEKELLATDGPEPIGVVNSIPAGFKPVPDDLTEEAEKVLQGQDRAFVDMTKDTPLIRWARRDRATRATMNNHKANNRRNMQKASKRRNRK